MKQKPHITRSRKPRGVWQVFMGRERIYYADSLSEARMLAFMVWRYT